MLGTFVIGLREGLEAALIVGIVAAFLRQQNRRDLLRWVWIGVLTAALICLAGGVALRLFSENLPQRQQEGLETVIGLVAVVMVTYMIVWMRRHSRELKGQIEGAAAEAVAAGSGWALVAMAFLAVLREGFETSVFLLAAFNESSNGASASVGATLGLVIAIAIGYGIYRGGVKLNLSRFFRVTGVLLVFVAGGLVVSALHTAHEAGWLNGGQGQIMDLTAVVQPGTIVESLASGILGIQPRPVFIEVLGWLLYVIPVGLYVGWPPGRSLSRRMRLGLTGGIAAAAAVAAVLLAVLAPSAATAVRPGAVQTPGGQSVYTVRVDSPGPSGTGFTAVVSGNGRPQTVDGTATRTGTDTRNGVIVDVYEATVPATVAADRPGELTFAQVSQANGGSLPFGVRAKAGPVPVTYADSAVARMYVDPKTHTVLDVEVTTTTQITAAFSTGVSRLKPQEAVTGWPSEVSGAEAVGVRTALDDAETRSMMLQVAAALGVVALISGGLFLWFLTRRVEASPAAQARVTDPSPALAEH